MVLIFYDMIIPPPSPSAKVQVDFKEQLDPGVKMEGGGGREIVGNFWLTHQAALLTAGLR
jgi:hypothetical protein